MASRQREGQVEQEDTAVRIGELAKLTGASTRALRHYEDSGVLVPDRTDSGYRVYSEADITRVAQIKAMIAAGLGTSTIKRYLDCARVSDHGIHLEMCPNLRAELDEIAKSLSTKQTELRQTQQRLNALASPG